MPTTTWNSTVIDGIDYWVIDTAKFRIPKNWDETSNMFIAVGVPDGGIGFFQAIAQGDDGATPDIDSVINRTVLEYDDPTADFASFSETSPNVYRLNMSQRKGPKGNDGDTILTPSDYGAAAFDKILRVNAAATGFELVSRKIGDRYLPGSIANTPSGNSGFTLCSVAVPALAFDWRPEVAGQCIVTGTGTSLTVDLIARLSTVGILNGETNGNEVGRAFDGGELSTTSHVRHIQNLFSGPPAGSPDAYDKVLNGNPATIYFRAERQTGGETFTTSNTTTRFKVRVCPVP